MGCGLGSGLGVRVRVRVLRLRGAQLGRDRALAYAAADDAVVAEGEARRGAVSDEAVGA